MWRNTSDRYGLAARLFHWTTAAAFIGAYLIVYYVIWVIADNKDPDYRRVLNIHWALGLLAGFILVPRLLWKLLDVHVAEAPGTALEHAMARAAHWTLYAFLIIMPITGYLGTRHGTSFWLFSIPSFADTQLFAWISTRWGLTFKEFEAPIDVVHHFLGKWVVWPIVGLHIAAALYHHWVRRDTVLTRMLGTETKTGGAEQYATRASEA